MVDTSFKWVNIPNGNINRPSPIILTQGALSHHLKEQNNENNCFVILFK